MTAKLRAPHSVQSILDEATQILGDEVAKMRRGEPADAERLAALEKITKMATAISEDARLGQREESRAVDDLTDEERDELMPLVQEHLRKKRRSKEEAA